MTTSFLRKLTLGVQLQFVLLGVIAAWIIGWAGLDAYSDYRAVGVDLPLDDRMQAAAARMLDLEERMTSAARRAVGTGDPNAEWEFRRTQPVLARTIQDAARLLSMGTQRPVEKIRAANEMLIAIEDAALRKARTGDGEGAKQALASDGLAAARTQYLQGLTDFNVVTAGTQSALHANLGQSLRSDATLTIASLVLLGLGTLLAFRTVRGWQAVVIEKNRQLEHSTEALAAFNRKLDKTVAERTHALTERTIELASAGKQLESSAAQYRLLFDNNPHPMWVYGLDSLRFLAVNASAVEHYGYSMDEFGSMTIRDIRPPEDVPALERDVRVRWLDGKNISCWRHRKKDGTLIDVEISSDRLKFNGVPARLILAHDITARVEAEMRLRRLNRVYKVLSHINGLIVRTQTREELFREACRIAVDAGEFVAASIYAVDPTTRHLRQAASHGAEGRSQTLPEGLARDEDPADHGKFTALFQKGEPLVCNDLENEPEAQFEAQASVPGVRAAVMVPLIVEDQTIGVLELLSADAHVFDKAEMKLLLELAGDIGFALATLDKAEELDYLAYFDQLTGLPNRKLFAERIGQKLAMASEEFPRVAVAYIEIADVARIYQSLGRNVSDALIRNLATRFTHAFASLGTIARLGENAFGVAIRGQWDEVALARVEEIFHTPVFSSPIACAGQEFQLDGHTGLSVSPADGGDPDALIGHAEAALNEARSSDEHIAFYDSRTGVRVAETLSLETKLRRAVEHGEFVLHYHPKVSSATRRIVAIEALMRWNEPGEGLVPPLKFIPILEETGLIVPVGAWALRQAAQDHARWLEQGLVAPRIAVNVSAVQLRKKDFVEVLDRAVSVPACGVDIEITESVVMRDLEDSVRKLHAIRERGMGVSMDDFGTGYSSLASLARLPVTEVKIDRSFVNTMITEPVSMSLVSTIISMAHSLGLKVVAEGVEQEEQAKCLELLRCDELQGYLFSKPLPFEAMTRLIGQSLPQANAQ